MCTWVDRLALGAAALLVAVATSAHTLHHAADQLLPAAHLCAADQATASTSSDAPANPCPVTAHDCDECDICAAQHRPLTLRLPNKQQLFAAPAVILTGSPFPAGVVARGLVPGPQSLPTLHPHALTLPLLN